MGWFDEQIKQKVKYDEAGFAGALMEMSGVIMGRDNMVAAMTDDRIITIEAVSQILRFYRVKPQEIPDSLKDMNNILEYLLRPSGFMRRKIYLQGDWYKNGIGAMLGFYKESGKAVAIIPDGSQGYLVTEEHTGKRVRVTAQNMKWLSEEALCFYKPLPLKTISMKELMLYAVQTLSLSDFAAIFLATMVVTLIGLLTPYANQLIFGNGVAGGNVNVLLSCAVLLVGVCITTAVFTTIRQLIMAKIKTKMNVSIESASMMRVLTLSAGFFKKYSAGELACRIQDINGLCSMMIEIVLTVGMAVIFLVTYLFQIHAYAPSLLGPVLLILLAQLLFTLISALVQMQIGLEKMELSAKESGLVFSIFSGIQKIKLSGAERRAFTKWAKQYTQRAELEYNPPMFVKINSAVRMGILLAGDVSIYYAAIREGMSAVDYMSFHVAYTMLMGAFYALASMSGVFAKIRGIFDMTRPILEEVPEVAEDKRVVIRLSGGIELSNVSFRYNETMPMILDNLSLKIRPGQYVAIVGKTGCGKSTLMRMLLGFEKPLKGAVYYDGKDLSRLDMKSLRKFMGVVMQNGKIFQGNIFSNITISAPGLTMEQAWEAAEMAGIAEDIRQMPMGMHTIISEGGGGFSGGQKQRLMIARAVAARPKILMFDEATSALDNITQKIVSDSLDKLKCTRIVIAHRLSTIKQCDRIVVLDKGRIIEDGTYEGLLTKKGEFAKLVERQRVGG